MDADTALQYGDPASAALNGSLSSVQNANKTLQGTLQQEDKAMQPALDKFKATAAQPMPQPPTPQKATPAPNAQDFNKDAQGWVTALAAFAALIGARGRARGTGALKAFAAGVNGVKQGSQQAFDNATKTWKENTEAMMKENDEELAKYKAVLENRELSEAEAQQQMKMIGYEYQNKVMSETHTADQAFAVYDSIVKARASVSAANAKMEAKAEEQKKIQEKATADAEKKYQDWKQTPKAIMDADAMAKGLPPSYYIRGRGKDAEQQFQFVQQLAAERHPGLDLAEATEDYKAASAALRSFGNGKQADTVRSFNVAYNHADVLNSLVDALHNKDFQAFNSAQQRFAQEFGSAAPTNFEAVKGIFADEVNKAAVGGAGALGDREQLRDNISRAASPEQLKGAIDVYKTLIMGQMQGMQKQYEESTGRKDFQRFLLPNVSEDLEKHASTPQSGTTSNNVVHWDDLK